MFFEERPWQPTYQLAPEQVAYFRRMLTVHANDPDSGQCRICRQPACPDWRYAYDQLAVAGQVMADPESWTNDGAERWNKKR